MPSWEQESQCLPPCDLVALMVEEFSLASVNKATIIAVSKDVRDVILQIAFDEFDTPGLLGFQLENGDIDIQGTTRFQVCSQ